MSGIDLATVVKVDGVEHRIPSSWLRGFCRAQGGLPAKTTAEAARFWHDRWKREKGGNPE